MPSNVGGHTIGTGTVGGDGSAATLDDRSGALFQGVCSSWCELADVCGDLDAVDGDVLTTMRFVASDILYDLTRRRWPGVCREIVRPCGCDCVDVHRCGCSWLSAVKLGGYPVLNITTVKVDGVELDPTTYRIDDHRWLVRLADADGSNPGWPCCQRLDLPDSEDRTFSVAYHYGSRPPLGGVTSSAALAYELALSCSSTASSKCRLPKRVQSVTRQGVTLAIAIDSFSLFDKGRTGIPEVDLWVASVNRGNSNRRATVIDPSRHRAIRRADT